MVEKYINQNWSIVLNLHELTYSIERLIILICFTHSIEIENLAKTVTYQQTYLASFKKQLEFLGANNLLTYIIFGV